ncbi:hypothetical protein VTO58DRAFT_102657 [Aureobasidium pullulans]
MAQRYFISGQYPEDPWHPAPPVKHWVDDTSSMAPPPYPDSHREHFPSAAEPEVVYYTTIPTQNQPRQSETLHQPNFTLPQHDIHQSRSVTQQQVSPSRPQQSLAQPVVIPQIAPGTAPFTRAYSPYLASLGIDMSTFIIFLDTLNIALSPIPPLQILDLAGGIVGMVPHHIPALIGGGLQASAKIAGAVTSKTRTNAVLDRANEEMFGVRGLKVEILGTDEVKRRVGITGQLLQDLDEESSAMNVQQRRLGALRPYTAPLSFDVPASEQQGNTIDRLSAAQLKRQIAKAEERALEQRKKDGKKADRKFEKEERKREKDRRKGKEEKQKSTKKDKESKAAEKLLWLFIGQI